LIAVVVKIAGYYKCNPHSVFGFPIHRPQRSLPFAVQWVQPIEE
jgi:hypothetical protein